MTFLHRLCLCGIYKVLYSLDTDKKSIISLQINHYQASIIISVTLSSEVFGVLNSIWSYTVQAVQADALVGLLRCKECC